MRYVLFFFLYVWVRHHRHRDHLNVVSTQPLCISGFLEHGLLFSSPPANTCTHKIMTMTMMMTWSMAMMQMMMNNGDLVDGPDTDAAVPAPAHHHLLHHMHTVHLVRWHHPWWLWLWWYWLWLWGRLSSADFYDNFVAVWGMRITVSCSPTSACLKCCQELWWTRS